MRIRTREENFWAKIAQDPAADKDMKPLTTEEYMMDQAAKVIEEGGGLPEVTSEDNGDVLAVVGGEWSKAPAPSPLPTVTSDDNGDLLTVVDGAWAKSPAPSSLPPYTSADKGKVLTVGEGSESETVVVVPEQTVTVEVGARAVPLSNVNYGVDDFTAGMTGIVSLNSGGESMDLPVTFGTSQGVTGFITNNPDLSYSVLYFNGWQFAAGEPEEEYTCTISLAVSVPSVEPKWEEIEGLPDTDTAYSGDVLMLGPNKNPLWGMLSSGAKVYAREWTYHNSGGSTSVTAGTTTTLHNTSEVIGWGIPSVSGNTIKFYVDVSPLLAVGLIPTSSIVSDLTALCNSSITDYVALTDIEVYPLKTQTITASQYFNVPVLVVVT